MFIYQTNDIFDKDGNGPLKGMVIKTTPNGQKDLIPATVGQTVLFFEENSEGISIEKQFEVGEKEEE